MAAANSWQQTRKWAAGAINRGAYRGYPASAHQLKTCNQCWPHAKHLGGCQLWRSWRKASIVVMASARKHRRRMWRHGGCWRRSSEKRIGEMSAWRLIAGSMA
jgi:hypothetical protein